MLEFTINQTLAKKLALKFCGTDLFELETIKFNKSGFVEIVRMIYLKTIMAFDQNDLFLGNQKKYS